MSHYTFRPLPTLCTVPVHELPVTQAALEPHWLNRSVVVTARTGTLLPGIVRIVSARSQRAYVQFTAAHGGSWSVSVAQLQALPVLPAHSFWGYLQNVWQRSHRRWGQS